MPGPGWYRLGTEEESEVLDSLRSGNLTRYRFDAPDDEQSKVGAFETRMAGLLGTEYSLALNSCTSALVSGLSALNIGVGDEVIVPGYTFIASIAAVLYVGARPVLAEIDESLSLDPDDVRRKVTAATRAIMPVHMVGAPADLAALAGIAREAACHLVEDVAQACGGTYRGSRLGSIGDFGAFSFAVGKTMTTGDGGLLATGSRALYEAAFAFHDHGFAPLRSGVVDNGPRIGLNLRMHELAGAVGLAQADKLDGVLEQCRNLKAALREGLGVLPGVSERVIHDPGECATAHVLIFDDARRAEAVAAALNGRVLGRSTKHNYALMAQLHAEFSQERVANGRPGDLPRTDDVLGRSVAIGTGLIDGYLGTVGPLTVLDDAKTAAEFGHDVRQLVLAL